MRVALITGEYPPDRGGVADYTRCLAVALATEGLAVDVLAPRRGDASSAAGRRRSTRGNGSQPDAERPARSAVDIRITEFRVAGVWGWGLPRALSRLLARTRPDVLHIQYQTAAFRMHPGVNVAPWLLRRTGTTAKTAVTYHDVRPPYLFPKAGRLRRTVTMLPARWSHLTIATNEEDYATIAEAGRPWQLEIVPIGSNIPDAPPDGYARLAWRSAAGLALDQQVVAYFGMLNESKGARDLVAAVAALARSGRNVRLALVGELVGGSDPTNAEYRARLEADIAAQGIGDRVIWTGHLAPADVSAWLHGADVVALPYVDGWSYRRGSLLAALEHGCPIVTTEPAPGPAAVVRSLPQLRHGESAWIVRPSDPRTLAAGIESLLDDRALAARIGAGAREIATHFSWTSIARKHVLLYREILDAG